MLTRWLSSKHGYRTNDRGYVRGRALQRLLAATMAAGVLLAGAGQYATAAPNAQAQRDPELRGVLGRAIEQAECFEDQYDSAVWYKMMEPRLRKQVPDREERLLLLKHVFCEAHRPGEVRLPPGLVMAVIDVESRFNRWAVSYAGAVGLMQVMPGTAAMLARRKGEAAVGSLSNPTVNLEYGQSFIELIRDRLRAARNDCEVRYGKED